MCILVCMYMCIYIYPFWAQFLKLTLSHMAYINMKRLSYIIWPSSLSSLCETGQDRHARYSGLYHTAVFRHHWESLKKEQKRFSGVKKLKAKL